jgi:hypothetical protein
MRFYLRNGFLHLAKWAELMRVVKRHLSHTNTQCMLQNSSHAFGSEAEKQQEIKKVFELSCHSMLLAKMYPNVSAAIHMVPEFIHAEACVGDCRVCNFFTSHYKWDWLRKT